MALSRRKVDAPIMDNSSACKRFSLFQVPHGRLEHVSPLLSYVQIIVDHNNSWKRVTVSTTTPNFIAFCL